MNMKPNEFFKLLMDRNRQNPYSLSKIIGVPQPTLSRFANGDSTNPQTQTLAPIAKYYKVPVDAFINEKATDAAHAEIQRRDLEALSEEIHISESPQKSIINVRSGPKMRAPVPLISWVQAGEWASVVDNFRPGDAEEWIPVPRNHGSRTFALRVRGISMEPKYHDGSIIFVDPDRSADHGKNVVVRLENEQEATFKQLVIEGDQKFLRPLNPEWPGPKLIQINGNATICGVVIGQFIPD